jgi:hypothetical protein
MMKLAANSEFRESMARVKEEMRKAGLDLSSPVRYAGCSHFNPIADILLQDVLEEVMNLQKTLGPK